MVLRADRPLLDVRVLYVKESPLIMDHLPIMGKLLTMVNLNSVSGLPIVLPIIVLLFVVMTVLIELYFLIIGRYPISVPPLIGRRPLVVALILLNKLGVKRPTIGVRIGTLVVLTSFIGNFGYPL